MANHQRPVACLLLHATAAGMGVHLYRSELPPANEEPLMASWLTAQAPWVNASAALSDKLADALSRSQIPRVASAASVRPVDSMTCPALVVELAPQDAGDADTENDAGYQSKVAEAIASELVFWRNQAKPPQKATPPPPPATATASGSSTTGSTGGGMR